VPDFKTDFATEIEQDPALVAAQSAAELKAAQEEEWGQFVAATRIYSASGALAFLPGHAVPASSVSDDGPVYPSQVVPRTPAVDRQVAQQRVAATSVGLTAGQVPADTRPAGNATAEEWRAYAVTQGMDEAEAGTKGRDELRDLYAG
jgi:hypothetical protein